ncbi:hypothetical protein OO009_08910 [Flavobacteriaceae bacterium KMM 6897]|nr:hypothetical protein [Flavobacteriaceae bacterium KMM 6897]MEB8344430.1 hypothetical protein [Flavobacteriaceae bacterium KMM 6898]
MAKFEELALETAYINGNRDYNHQMGIINARILVHDSIHFDNSFKFFFLWKRQNDGTYKIKAEVSNTEDND